MKRWSVISVIWGMLTGIGGMGVVFAQPAALPPLPGTVSGGGPRMVFASPVFDFGRLASGQVARHDFIFTNAGDAVLEVTAVRASCGCTTAGEYSRRVEPGQTGQIPIQFNSGAFNGEILKTVTVQSNDPKQPAITLQIKGTIWRPVEVNPQFAILQVTSESVSNATTTVRIIHHLEEPLVLSPPESQNPHFAAELRTNQPGREYELVVRVVPPLEGANRQGVISLNTSLTNPPNILVTAMVFVQPDVVIIPPQIMVPANPLTQDWSTVITIRNQLNAPFELSQPEATVDGVRLHLDEIDAGRAYTLTATFPAGFQFPAGAAECLIQSSQPRQPVVKIPILRAR